MAVVAAAVVGAITGQHYLVGIVTKTFGAIGISLSPGVALGIAGGFGGGFASGFAGSLLNGGSLGDAFRAGLVGGAVGAVTGGLLGKIGAQDYGWFERGLAHGTVQGAAAEATGGEFRHGFYSGFAVGATEARIGKWAKESNARGITAAAVVGGTASALGGGKFANGAVSGAFSYMFNQLSQSLRERIRANADKKLLESSGSVRRVVLMEGRRVDDKVYDFWQPDSRVLMKELGVETIIDYFETPEELFDLASKYRDVTSPETVLVVDVHGQGASFLTRASSEIGGIHIDDELTILPRIKKIGWGEARFVLGHCESVGGISSRFSQDYSNSSRAILGKSGNQ